MRLCREALNMKLDTSIRNNIKGLIYGQAIGDALGLGTEFMSKAEVRTKYPDGLTNYDQIFQDKHRSRWKKGSWTDDTDQFLCILNSINDNGNINLLDTAKRFHDWYLNNPMGIGRTTLSVLSMPQYTLYPQKAAELVWKLKKKKVAPNGGVMRTSIVGVWNFWDQESVLINSSQICGLTHHDQRCMDSCKVVGYLVSSELNKKPVEQNRLQKFISKQDLRVQEYFAAPFTRDISALHLDNNKDMGYTLKTLSAGLWAYYHAGSFEDGIMQIIHEGGDADTNGCVVGSLLGVKYGFSSIPESWVDGLGSKEVLEKKYKKLIEVMEVSNGESNI